MTVVQVLCTRRWKLAMMLALSFLLAGCQASGVSNRDQSSVRDRTTQAGTATRPTVGRPTALDELIQFGQKRVPAGADILEAAEQRFYDATLSSLSEAKRREVAQYLIAIRLILDTQEARFANLRAADQTSANELANALDSSARLWEGNGDLIDELSVPEAYLQHHPVLLKGIRALANVDRNAADHLRKYGNTHGYTTGESERQAAFSAIQSAFTGIIGQSDRYFPQGLAVDLFTEPPNPGG